VAGWPVTGVLNITAAVWTAGFHWWRSGTITRTQNVSENMLVLALCLVAFVAGKRTIMNRQDDDNRECGFRHLLVPALVYQSASFGRG